MKERDKMKLLKFNKYLSDIEGNNEKIEELFNVNAGLLKAPTGAGKTRTLIEISKKVSRETGRRIIITVPKKKQAEQIEKEYNIPAVTGDTKEIDSNSLVIACVYDSINKVFGIKDWIVNDNVTVIVDECHRMNYDSIFRSRALNNIKKVIKDTRYIFISATTEIVEYIDFNLKIECKAIQSHNNYGTCIFYNYEDTLAESLLGIVNTCTRENPITHIRSKAIVFLNDKIKLKVIKKTLELEGYSVGLLTSDTKEEPAMKTLVETSELKGFDIYLCTSVIEEGININNKELFTCIYVMDSVNACYDSLEQACARLRQGKHISVVMKKKNKDEDKILQDTSLIIDEKELEEAKKKTDIVNQIYKIQKENGFLTTNKIFIDSLAKGKYYIFNDELGLWEFNEDRYRRKQFLDRDKTISQSDDIHDREVRKRVKADNFIYYIDTNNKISKEKTEQLKEISKEEQEKRKEERTGLLKIVSEFSEPALFTLETALISNSIEVKGIPINEVEKGYIDMIRKDKDISNLFREMQKNKIDIKETLEERGTDFKTLKSYVRRETYKKRNLLVVNECITLLDLKDQDAGRYYKIRKIGDSFINKSLNKTILKKVYKIENPNHKGKDLSDKQLEKAINILEDVYVVYTKTNGQIKLGNLTK